MVNYEEGPVVMNRAVLNEGLPLRSPCPIITVISFLLQDRINPPASAEASAGESGQTELIKAFLSLSSPQYDHY